MKDEQLPIAEQEKPMDVLLHNQCMEWVKSKWTSGAFISFFRRMGKSVWAELKQPVQQLSVFKLILIVLISIIATSAIGIYRSQQRPIARDQVNYLRMDPMSQFKALKASHLKYLSMTPEERLFMWVATFKGWHYQLNGDPKYKTSDCVGAVYKYFTDLGSNIRLENVSWLYRRIVNLNERELLKLRTSQYQIQSGDIIIFYFNEGNQHVGVVYDVCDNGLVRYMDMNTLTRRWGLEHIPFGSAGIKCIAEVSFPLWVGDILQEFESLKSTEF